MDLAEVIGTAIALNLLLNIPLIWGVILTSLDVLIILFFWSKSSRSFEILILMLVMSTATCIFILVAKSPVNYMDVFIGYLPSAELVTDRKALLLTIGIIGATVMPHNLYLHSNLVISRSDNIEPEDREKAIRSDLRISYYDSAIALIFALFVNSSILIVSSANFYSADKSGIADIHDAYALLSESLGTSAATLFALALLFAGQSSTITGTLTGQIVMEGLLILTLKDFCLIHYCLCHGLDGY